MHEDGITASGGPGVLEHPQQGICMMRLLIRFNMVEPRAHTTAQDLQAREQRRERVRGLSLQLAMLRRSTVKKLIELHSLIRRSTSLILRRRTTKPEENIMD